MDFSKLLGVGLLLSTCFLTPISPAIAGDLKNTFGNNSITVTSTWSTRVPFQFENIEQVLVDALGKNSVFKRVSVGGRSETRKKIVQRVFKDLDDFWGRPQEVTIPATHLYLFLKPSYAKLPISLMTLERTGAGPTAQSPRGFAQYALVSPVHFYYDYVDVARRPFSAAQVSLELELSQQANEVTFETSFQVNQLSFVSWINSFLTPLRLSSDRSADVKDILTGMRMVFEAIHQYFALHY